MKTGATRVAIVIPALNEEATIGAVVQSVKAYGIPIVVDDGSSDATARVAEQAGATVFRHPQNAGYEAAIQSGFERADEIDIDIVMTFDADGQHESGTIDSILSPLLEDRADLVLGIRAKNQRLVEGLFNTFMKKRFAVPDMLCGLKAYRIELYRQHGRFDGTSSVGTELAIVSLANGARFSCVPVPIRPRADRPRFGSTLNANWRLLRALWSVRSLASARQPSRPETT